MKKILIPALMLTMLAACTSSQRVTSSWVNREALPKQPFKSVFILALTSNLNAKIYVEREMAKLITARGQKAVKSSDIFTPVFLGSDTLTPEKVGKAVKDSGCDAVVTLALLDVKTETSYQPGTTYYPAAPYYGSFGRYYGHYYSQMYEPGYYVTDKTYFVETNFYNAVSGVHLWSIQSDAYNPSSLESWFYKYSKLITFQLKKEGLIGK
jgi:hypothetical protein